MRRAIRTITPLALVLSGLLLVAAACGGPAGTDSDGAADAEVADDVVLEAGPDSLPDGSPEASPDAAPVAQNVTLRDDLGATPPCPDPDTCKADYLAFVEKAAGHARPTTEDAIHQALLACDAGEVPLVPGPLPPDDLAAAIVDGLNIGFLQDGLDERPLTVTTIARTEAADHVEEHLLLEDPWVGTFEGLLLTPPGPGPFPAVLALHGHGDSVWVYRDEYHGGEYPAHGLAILMLGLRVMGSGPPAMLENDVAKKMLVQGFTLMGMRVYESLLGFKLLNALPRIDGTRVGLIGHSGGSSTGNLTSRLERRLKAYVSDYQVAYVEWTRPYPFYHCETVPALYPYSALINDPATSEVPILKVPYKYTDGMDGIFAFFACHLRGSCDGT